VPATLRSLRIQNLALVESLEWEVAAAFSVVTGETGAGKSVILGALKLVLGERADKSLIRTGADQCSVEALFELDEVAEINRAFGDQGIEPCEEGQLLLKRIFSVSGGNRQFINGSQTTLGVLKQIGDGLVDLHGPHDHQSLLSREQQLILVDAFGDSGELLRRYQASFQEVNRLREQREKVRQQTADQNLDLWRHQLRELEAADLKPCELQILETRYHVAANSRRLMEISGSILRQLSEVDQSVLSQLTDIARQLRELNRLDESTNELLRAHEAATIELEELERGVVRYQARLEINPEELQQMEERLNLLQSLQRKHQRDAAGLIELIEDLKARLEFLDRREEMLAELSVQLARESSQLRELGGQLTQCRVGAAKKLAGEIGEHLKDLGFNRAAFEIQIDPLAEPRGTGFEAVEYLFAPNPGEPLKPLKAIASSGEISRVMLAVKTALAQEDLIGLLVFDEIDANVGGEIAHSIGMKMRSLGGNRQVLAITHMPQVAAAATHHFYVSKAVTNGRTRTSLTEVVGNDRVEELARMLGGKTKSALEHAKALLRASLQ
jgi:DNA repair protein RecN (Recombination protein N)